MSMRSRRLARYRDDIRKKLSEGKRVTKTDAYTADAYDGALKLYDAASEVGKKVNFTIWSASNIPFALSHIWDKNSSAGMTYDENMADIVDTLGCYMSVMMYYDCRSRGVSLISPPSDDKGHICVCLTPQYHADMFDVCSRASADFSPPEFDISKVLAACSEAAMLIQRR